MPLLKNTVLLANVNHHLIRQGCHKSSSYQKKKNTVSAKHNTVRQNKRSYVYTASSIRCNDQENKSEYKGDRLKGKNLECLALHMTLCCYLLSHSIFATPWTVARQAPLSMGILQARTLEWVAMPSSRGSS